MDANFTLQKYIHIHTKVNHLLIDIELLVDQI